MGGPQAELAQRQAPSVGPQEPGGVERRHERAHASCLGARPDQAGLELRTETGWDEGAMAEEEEERTGRRVMRMMMVRGETWERSSCRAEVYESQGEQGAGARQRESVGGVAARPLFSSATRSTTPEKGNINLHRVRS